MTKAADVDKIAGRIRSLLAKTVDNGCTEAEALSAAEMAARMMAEHDLTLDDVRLREDGFSSVQRPVDDLLGMVLWKVASAIAHLCQVRSFNDTMGRVKTSVEFFGLASDVEVACYLLEIVERSMRDALAEKEKADALMRKSVRRRRAISFLDGMADRLYQRIREISWARRRAEGTGLVVLKEAMIAAELARQGFSVNEKRDRYSQAGFGGYADGRAAAERVTLEAGVGTGRRPTGALSDR